MGLKLGCTVAAMPQNWLFTFGGTIQESCVMLHARMLSMALP